MPFRSTLEETAAAGEIIHNVYIDPRRCRDLMIADAILWGFKETANNTGCFLIEHDQKENQVSGLKALPLFRYLS